MESNSSSDLKILHPLEGVCALFQFPSFSAASDLVLSPKEAYKNKSPPPLKSGKKYSLTHQLARYFKKAAHLDCFGSGCHSKSQKIKSGSSPHFLLSHHGENGLYLKIDEDDRKGLDKLLREMNKGLKKGILPELCEEGEGGTYFVKNSKSKNIGVFKPRDEEPCSENNPKTSFNPSFCDRREDPPPPPPLPLPPLPPPLRKGIRFGEAAIREVAAYLLDKDHFSGVPPTFLMEFQYKLKDSQTQGEKKIGSFQTYVDHECCSEDISFSLFPAFEVHKIGILDIRMFNTDRHGGNILVKKTEKNPNTKKEKIDPSSSSSFPPSSSYSLVPIDHGFCLPDEFSEALFEWYTWPQAKIPFDEKTKLYIEGLNPQEDAEKLRSLGIREECIKTMIFSTILLKKACSKGLNLFQIASLLVRKQGENDETILEKLIERLKAESKLEEREKKLQRSKEQKKDTKELYQRFEEILDEELRELFIH